MKNLVNISITSGYENLESIISSAIDNIGGLELKDGDRVIIKPNLCNIRDPSSGAITHPLFIDSLLCYLRKTYNDLQITFIESDATSSRPDITLKWFGFDKILSKWGAKWYNVSNNPKIVRNINGLSFNEMEISDIFNDYDYFITLPKLKTHSLTKITVSLKNQFGCIPYKIKSKYHRNIDEVIADANLAMHPDLCLVDGIISMGGGVAIYGNPIRSNLLIAGNDPVSVDTVSAKIFNYNSSSIKHIQLAKKVGVGSDKYILVGNINDIKQVRIDREYPLIKEIIFNVGRYIRDKHDLAKYFKRIQS
ncbi:MAG: DUF362 domain-containing protein [Candidatus Methanoperedens sp.]|nr:DUF362 domain-containing protein [Candidatus Methanoperedens sp.]